MNTIIKTFTAIIFISCLCISTFLALSFAAFTGQDYSEAPLENILSYDTYIKVNKDSSLLVTESITVEAKGDLVKRGIYRDFPTIYTNILGIQCKTGFEIISVERDGVKENYFQEGLMNGVRTYIGKEDYLLPYGTYKYKIIYKTDRQLGYFDNHDELYFNALGTDWAFPVNNFSATIELPQALTESQLQLSGFSGKQGSTNKDFTVSTETKSDSTLVKYQTTRRLLPHEGLTVLIGFPKNIVTQQDPLTKGVNIIFDNLTLLIGLIGFILITLGYFILWFLFGRDPKGKTVIPQFTPPQDISPAVARFISTMEVDEKSITSALTNLAAKGIITIEQKKNEDYSIKRLKNDITGATQEEIILLSKFTPFVDSKFTFDDSSPETMKSAKDEFVSSIKNRFENSYIKVQSIYFYLGILASIPFVLILISPVFRNSDAMGFIIGFIVAGIFLSLLGGTTISEFKSLMIRETVSFSKLFSFYISLIFPVFLYIATVALGFMISKYLTFWGVLILLIIILVHFIFKTAIKARTKDGVNLLSEIEGFKMFMSIADKYRYAQAKLDSQLYEKYLPYSIALDVESAWTKNFHDYIKTSSAIQKDNYYSPVWYHGFGSNSFSASSFSSSFSSSVASASTVSSSSSGFSGGSSGGGGGGGGGGGW